MNEHRSPLRKPIIVTSPDKLELPNFREVWEARELLLFLTERDFKVRFQQTAIGVLWIVIQPIIQMLIFYVVLGILVKVPTGNIPYPIFFLSGFLVWQLFSQIVNGNAFSLLGNIGIITKTYFPRLVLPFSSTISSLVDYVISFILLLVFLLANGFSINLRYLFLPVFVLITLFFSSGVGLLFGALMVTFRDVKNFLGFIMMVWMYATPIIFPISLVPKEYQIILTLNPLTVLVEAHRWVFLKSEPFPPISHLLVSFVVAVIIWIAGAIAFRNMENRIADVM